MEKMRKPGEEAKVEGTQKDGGTGKKKKSPFLPFFPFFHVCAFSIQQTRLYLSLEQAVNSFVVRPDSD